MWQTVSVKTVDEGKEWEEHEKAVDAMKNGEELEVRNILLHLVY
jgi:hypothetical protein